MKPELRTALAEKGRCDLPGVLLAAAECAPLAKTGGLADVVGTLPKSLAALGFDARVITPYHRVIKEKYAAQVTHLTDFYIDLGWRHQYVGIERLLLDGIVIYLVDNEFYFGDRIYLGGEAEGEQYAFFARAILEALPRLDFTPEVLHCNDWHTAVLPMLTAMGLSLPRRARASYSSCEAAAPPPGESTRTSTPLTPGMRPSLSIQRSWASMSMMGPVTRTRAMRSLPRPVAWETMKAAMPPSSRISRPQKITG